MTVCATSAISWAVEWNEIVDHLVIEKSGTASEHLNRGSSVSGALQAYPDGLGAGLTVALASEEPAERSHQADHLVERDRRLRRGLLNQQVGTSNHSSASRHSAASRSGHVLPSSISLAMRQATINFSARIP